MAGLRTEHWLRSARAAADAVLRGVTLKNAGLKPSDVNIMGVSPAVAVQSLVSGRVDAAFLFEPYDRIAQLVAPVRQVYEIGEVWPFPCMVVITSGDTLAKRKDAVWKSLDAQRDAIELLDKQPAEAAKLIAGYFIAEPTLKTLKRGELAREVVIEGGHWHPDLQRQAWRRRSGPYSGACRHSAGAGLVEDSRWQAVRYPSHSRSELAGSTGTLIGAVPFGNTKARP